nr:DUF4011 domain-containing protein [Cytobacillus eiseniae]
MWKSRLLDFSKRNRLINFKTTKSTIRVDAKTCEVFDLLNNEKELMVNAHIDLEREARKQIQVANKKELSKEETDEMVYKNIIKLKQKLEKQLNEIRLKGKSSIDEKGVNTLYLACGFLNWTEAEQSNIILKSPLFLVPLSLYRDTAREPYYMYKADEVIFNPVLEQKLKIDFGVKISSLEDLEYESFDDLLKIYSEQVKIEDNWMVTSESYIGLFSFNKLVMFKDFEQYEDYVKGNTFIQTLAGIKQEKDICDRENIEDIKIADHKGTSEQSFQILDADSSQQEAILAAKNGVSFVIQGPPGTGKSQTITNIIAESLAQGKKVLFVSEKKAALEVVKKRIDEKGLSDYCLDLHSHNANKKAVLEELRKSIDQKQSPDYKSPSFSEFDEIKHKLNLYVRALHQTVDPLNETVQKIHGKLSALHDTPVVLFDIPEVQKINNERLTEMKKTLIRLEKMKSLIGKEDEHLWKGAIPKDSTFDLESNIKANFIILAKNIRDLYDEFKKTANMVSFEGELSLGGIDHILDLNTMIINKPDAPSNWFGSNGRELLEKAKDQFEHFESLFSSIKIIKEELFLKYKNDILNIDHHKIHDTITSKYKKEILNYTDDYENFIDKSFKNEQKIKSSIEKIIQFYYEIDKINKKFQTLTRVHTKNINEKDIFFLEKLYDFIRDNPQPTKEWFEMEKKDEIRKIIKENIQLFQSFHAEKQKLETDFDLKILEEDLEGILNRYIQEYSSFLRHFNKNFKRDKTLIKSYLLDKKKLQHEKIIKELRSLNSLKEMKNQIAEQNSYLSELFGRGFNSEKTDWEMISSHVEKIFSLNTFLMNEDKKDIYLSFVLQLENQTIIDFKEIIDQLRSLYQSFHEEVQNLRIEFMPKLWELDENTNFLNFESEFHEIIVFINEIINAKNEVEALLLNSSDIHLKKIEELFSTVNDINHMEGEIENQSDTLSLLYGKMFKGYETDWYSVKEAINWTVNAEKNYQGWFPIAFVEVINDPDKFAYFSSNCSQLERKRESLEKQINFYQKIFPFDEKKFNGQAFFNAQLSQMAFILDLLAENANKLQEWITYQEARSNVYELGLKDFINKMIEEDQLNASFEKVFLKRFYQLWLDNVYSVLPALKHFRIDQHERLLKEFKEFDVLQIDINSARVHEILTDRKENYVETTAHLSSEFAILKREIQKQKRHKSIRNLFSTMPDLIMALKPCMMMSPLSVCQFIDPSILNFDVVIFDEASQIRPEDAIGTIMRGKQLIVAGDDKQLPPTSFFASQIEMDDEFIEEEDEEIYESFESILDECLLFMPQISLKWHYRSKQESLIAFSNKEIYNNELYTFPNSIQSEHDGISNIYVEDGVYDRGKSKKNLKEAEKVAELVFEHIKRSKDRSLGIITFSEPQQIAIRDKIDEFRKQHPEHEDFFSENHLESFFVKNIENVQGDERDTIIISVGYAKDVHGQMYYNFGPLNHDGGERRLNVAVSRAKKEIKVVSSILDIDLDDAKLNKRGTKLLKSYLAYAKSNGEFSYNAGIEDDADFDSPFEEDVYRTLQRKGLELRKQVGCSGYRIDLAVVDPQFPGQYILGIECDGATYHSSKTARDRDRLRQSVLESLGWKIERIWSQDWVKRKQEIADSIANKVRDINSVTT